MAQEVFSEEVDEAQNMKKYAYERVELMRVERGPGTLN